MRRDGEVSHCRACLGKKHHPLWDETTILIQARNDSMHLIKEAFHITLAKLQKLLNRDQGTAIADCWRPLLRRVQRDSYLLLRRDGHSPGVATGARAGCCFVVVQAEAKSIDPTL